MSSLRLSGFAALLLLSATASAEDVWSKNDGYLKSAINDCSAADADIEYGLADADFIAMIQAEGGKLM